MSITSLRWLLCSSIILSCHNTNAVCEEHPSPSVAEITTCLERAQQSLFTNDTVLRMQYSRYSSEDITPTKFSGQLLPADWLVGHVHGSDWYTHVQFRLPETEMKETSQLPRQPIVHMLKDGMALDWTPHIRRCVINPVDPAQAFNVFQGWEYLRNAGYNPYRKILSNVGVAYPEAIQSAAIASEFALLNDLLLPGCLEKYQGKYRVKPALTPDGHQCWLVEWEGMDQIWLDESIGFAVRKRITHWSEGQATRRKIQNRDFREIKPGVWLPFAQVVDEYSNIHIERENIWDRIANRSHYRIDNLSLDGDADKICRISLPQGTLVNDFVRNVDYTVASPNTDPFEAPPPQPQPLTKSRPGLRYVIIANCLGLAAAIFIGCFWGRLRNRFP